MQVCPNCKHENRAGVVFCENCGASLIGDAPLATRSIPTGSGSASAGGENSVLAAIDAMKQAEGAAIGGGVRPNMVIRVEISGTKPFLLRPKQEIIFGRKDPATGTSPDVDMTPYAGYRMGVSRRHAAIRKMEDARLYLWDLGSANGTFLNGTRLTSYRPHLLHHGDEVRLSQISFKVFFQEAPKVISQVIPTADGNTAPPANESGTKGLNKNVLEQDVGTLINPKPSDKN